MNNPPTHFLEQYFRLAYPLSSIQHTRCTPVQIHTIQTPTYLLPLEIPDTREHKNQGSRSHTETEGLRPEFSPTHHPYIFLDCIKTQLEKQWDNCNCILIQRWGGDRSRGYYRLRDLSLMWNTPATITLSRTEINTKHTYDCMHSAIWWSCMPSTRYQSIGFLW